MTIPCIFCDFKADSLAALKEHSATCKEHPAVKRCTDAENYIASLELALGDSQEQVARLTAELHQTPPTLEWLKQQFGEPEMSNRELHHWGKLRNMSFLRGAQIVLIDDPNDVENDVVLPTRAAVLAAVAEQR